MSVRIAVACVVGTSAMLLAQTPAPVLGPKALSIGAGYAAKRLASGVFVSGRTVASLRAEEFASTTPLGALLLTMDVQVDREASMLTVRLMGAERSALHRPGFGCSLVGADGAERLRAQVEHVPAYERQAVDLPRPERPMLGVDEEALEKAVAVGFKGDKTGTRAIVILHRGALVAERYADGFGPQTRLEGWSMAKSVVNALVGIRVRSGEMELDGPVGLKAWAHDERRVITVCDALAMRSGLAWREDYADITSDVPRMLFAEEGAGRMAADSPLESPPGERWYYSSGTTNILCAALRETFDAHVDYLMFPRAELFEKVGMDAVMELDPSGTFVGSSFMFATARSWARLGQLFLQDGVWDGERLLPEGWVGQSTQPVAGSGGGYGLHWWLPRSDALPSGTYKAAGFEQQLLVVVPSHDLVIVRLGCTHDSRDWPGEAFLAGVITAFEE